MRRFDEKSRDSYNQKADDYDNTFDGKFTLNFKELLLKEMKVNANDTVLDVACGNGTLLKMLSDQYDIIGYGTDISEKMIENARKKCPAMTFEVAGCEHTSFKTKGFDIITVCAAYHHFPAVKTFANEVKRLLKTDGLLYIAEVYYPIVLRKLFNPFIPFSKAGDVKFYSPKEIADNFNEIGFTQVGMKIAGHIQIITMRKI